MAQLSSSMVVEPFGEVNVLPQVDGTLVVRATILMEPQVEGAKMGIAIDGSASMKPSFGASGVVSSLFAASAAPNIVEPVVRTMASYLAKFDTDGRVAVIFWACGPGGGDIEDLGEVDAARATTMSLGAPKRFGTGTQLLPALRFFTETKFPNAPWSTILFVTDGEIEDLPAVKQYTLALAQQIAAGQRNDTKLVLLGVGAEVNEAQMTELDDLDYGGLKYGTGDDIDLWDHKLTSDMKKLEEVFAEVVSRNTLLAPSAEVVDGAGNAVRPLDRASYKDGLPAMLEFVVPAGTGQFSLLLPSGVKITQPLVG